MTDERERHKDHGSCFADITVLRRGILAVSALIDESEGVVGLYPNGDAVPWSALLAGGQLQGWLYDFSTALALVQKELAND